MKSTVISVLLLLFAAVPLAAGRIDVTYHTSAWVATGSVLEVQFGVWTYGNANPLCSRYPTQIRVQLDAQGLDPAAVLSGVPDSTLEYYEGYYWYGVLESMDGSFSAPLVDDAMFGLPPGYLLVLPGVFAGGGGSTRMGVSTASVWLTEEESQLLFGENIGSYNAAARIRFENIGQGVLVGGHDGYAVRNWVTEPGLGGAGEVQTGGVTGNVTVVSEHPEPATWLTLAGALLLLAAGRRRLAAIRFRT